MIFLVFYDFLLFHDLEFKALSAKDREILAHNEYYAQEIILEPSK